YEITLDEASLLLRSLPFDGGEGAGTYSVDGSLEDMLGRVDGDQVLGDRLRSLHTSSEEHFRASVVGSLSDIREVLARVEEKVKEMEEKKSSGRRRRRGELFEPNPQDSDELREARRTASVEVAQA